MKYIFLTLLLAFFHQHIYSQKNINQEIKVEISLEGKFDSLVSTYGYLDEIKRYGYTVKSDSVKVKFCNVNIEIINTSSKPIHLWFMSCSWYESFELNNNNMMIESWGCDKNVPKKIKLESNQKLTYKILLSQSLKYDYSKSDNSYGTQDTKIGLIVFGDFIMMIVVL